MKLLSLITFCLAACVWQDLVFAQETGGPVDPAGEASKATQADSASVDKSKQPQSADTEPGDLTTQLTLAQRLFNEGDAAKAWRMLRGLYEKSPDEPGVLKGIQAVVDGYKLQGKLNVGTPEKSIIELLGQPHDTVKMPWGIRHIYGAMAIDFRDGKIHEQIDLEGATEDLFYASHFVDADLGNNPVWDVGVRQKIKGLTTAFLFPEGQSIAQWTELVTVERFVGYATGSTLSDIFERTEKQIKEIDAEATVIIAEQEANSIIFAVSYPEKDDRLAKQQLVRMWAGPRDVHRLAYTHLGAIPSEKDGKRWFSILKKAVLKPYGPSVSPTAKGSIAFDQVKALAETIRTDLEKASQYKPTPAALAAIAATDEDQSKLQAYCETMYKELEPGKPAANSKLTEIIIFGPKFEDLPGGYTSKRQHFKADVKFYAFKYVAPGETTGVSFDGAFEVEGKWYFLPKAHRAFK
jgi:hypothetical protein